LLIPLDLFRFRQIAIGLKAVNYLNYKPKMLTTIWQEQTDCKIP